MSNLLSFSNWFEQQLLPSIKLTDPYYELLFKKTQAELLILNDQIKNRTLSVENINIKISHAWVKLFALMRLNNEHNEAVVVREKNYSIPLKDLLLQKTPIFLCPKQCNADRKKESSKGMTQSIHQDVNKQVSESRLAQLPHQKQFQILESNIVSLKNQNQALNHSMNDLLGRLKMLHIRCQQLVEENIKMIERSIKIKKENVRLMQDCQNVWNDNCKLEQKYKNLKRQNDQLNRIQQNKQRRI